MLFSSPEAREARRRAAAIRTIVHELTGGFGPARFIACEHDRDECVLRYAVVRISLARAVRITVVELSILRVAMARAGARLLPAALLAREDDVSAVTRLLEHGEASIAVPE